MTLAQETLSQKERAKLLLRELGAALCGLYGAWSWLSGPRPRLPFRADEIQRILVIRLDLMGDLVFSLPTIDALCDAFPGAEIDALVLPYTAPLLQHCPRVHTVYALDVNLFRRPGGWASANQLASTIRQLRSRHYDLALGLSGLMGGVFAALSGATWRVGYPAESYSGCFNVGVAGRRYEIAQHEVDYCLDLVRALKLSVPPRWPRIELADGAPPPANLGGEQYAVLAPGASNGAAKRWPARHWAALGDQISSEMGLSVVLSGGASERALAQSIVDEMSQPTVNLSGETSLAGLAPLLGGARLVVAGDTGPLHLAAALSRPVVGIFGPTDPINTGPLSHAARVVRLGLGCSPCYDLISPADCKLPDRSTPCMWGLTPLQVMTAIREVLEISTPDG